MSVTRVKVSGIAASGTWAGGDLYLPLEDIERDWRGGWAALQAGKVGTSQTDDISTNLITYPLFSDLSGGAFARHHNRADKRYYLPSPNGTGDALTTGPLAWTSVKQAPFMCGCGWTQENPTGVSFSDMVEYKGSIYGLDTTSKRVLRWSGTAWQVKAGSSTTWRDVGAAGTTGNITNITNGGAGGICRVTSAGHGMANGDTVIISGVVGSAGLTALLNNKAFVVTAKATDTFDLTGAVFTGTYTSGGSWVCDEAGLTKAPTELYVKTLAGSDRILFVGQGAAGDGSYGREFDGTNWSNFTNNASPAVAQNAQHYAYMGGRLWWSTGNQLKERVATGARIPKIGDADNAVNRFLWANDEQAGKGVVLVGKPEGIYYYDPSTSQDNVQPIIEGTPDTLNGTSMVAHSGFIWFNFNDRLYAWKTGALLDKTFDVMEGSGAYPFYSGVVVGLWSDGPRLYVIYRVNNGSTYDYYVMIYTGDGFHPIAYFSSASAPTVEPRGLLLYANKLHYSVGLRATGASYIGWLYTNGAVPMGDVTTPYTRNVAITTGRITFDRDAVPKWFKELTYSMVDQGGSATWNLKTYYRKMTETTWTLLAAGTAGSKDNVTLTIPKEANAEAGITATAVEIKLALENSGASPTSAGYVKNADLVGLPVYPCAYQCTLKVLLKAGTSQPGVPSAGQLLDALKAAMNQTAAVTITHPDKGTFVGRFTAVNGGDEINSVDRNTQTPKERHITVTFVEGK